MGFRDKGVGRDVWDLEVKGLDLEIRGWGEMCGI